MSQSVRMDSMSLSVATWWSWRRCGESCNAASTQVPHLYKDLGGLNRIAVIQWTAALGSVSQTILLAVETFRTRTNTMSNKRILRRGWTEKPFPEQSWRWYLQTLPGLIADLIRSATTGCRMAKLSEVLNKPSMNNIDPEFPGKQPLWGAEAASTIC